MRVLNISLCLMVLVSSAGFTAALDLEGKREPRKIIGRLSDGRVLVQRSGTVAIEAEDTAWFRKPNFLSVQWEKFQRGPYGDLAKSPDIKNPKEKKSR